MGEQSAAAVPARRGRPGYDRAGMLDVAVRTFIERGYDATSVAILAERLGLSKSAIYHHFPSKEKILAAALDEALDALEAVLDSAGSAAGSAVERLEAVVRGAVHVLIHRLPYVTLLLRVRGNTDTERAALTRRRRFDRRVTALVEAAQQAGELRADVDPRVAERLLLGMVNSIVEWYRPGGRESASRLADDVVALAFGGLRA